MFFQCLHDLDARNALVGGPIAKVEKNVEALPDTPGDLIDRGRLPQILHPHCASEKKGLGSHGQSSEGKGSARRSWLVSRQIRINVRRLPTARASPPPSKSP